ncbi:MAG: hypothetical protein KAI66_08875, partial [Lentisphaeria bacterium]|nr:hypothetical protein [Lentisphaeria bacterium]
STSANGFDSCADHDTDGCLEWGGFTACVDPETCSNGVCSDPSQCQNDCSPGDRECDGNSYRTCGNFDADSCLDWSTYTNCDPGDVCNQATGFCEAECSNQCTAGTLRCAVDQSAVESCADRDSDGCTEWGTAIPCGEGTHCENNACVSSCTPDCTQQGERVCTTFNGDPGYETCGDHDADPCLEYGNFIACPEGQTCSNGICSATCGDECTSMQRQCQGNAVQLCGEANDGDTCLDWLPPVACEAWQQCLDGVCQNDCNTHNECSTEGAKVCTADNSGWQECVSDYDTDPCLEYGAVTNCQTNYICENGACVLGCEPECTTLNAVQCAGAGAGTETCEDHDSDGCLEWGGYDACPNGETCSLGVCAS